MSDPFTPPPIPKPPKPPLRKRFTLFVYGLHAWAENQVSRRLYRKHVGSTDPIQGGFNSLRDHIYAVARNHHSDTARIEDALLRLTDSEIAQREAVDHLTSAVINMNSNINRLTEQIDRLTDLSHAGMKRKPAPTIRAPKPRKRK